MTLLAESPMKVRAILPYFGGKRTLADRIVAELGPHKSYWNPCVGGFCVELAKPVSAHEHVNDLHGDLINLAHVLQDLKDGPLLYRRLRRSWNHETAFEEAKAALARADDDGGAGNLFGIDVAGELTPLDRAYLYFLISWQGRNGVAGTARVNYQPSVRWTSGGGHGGIRFKNAVDSIPAWRRRMRSMTILRRDLFEIVSRIEDQAGTVIYVDPPYIRDGIARSGSCQYLHEFGVNDHARLAKELARFRHVRIVVSYYAHPMLADLYRGWTFVDCARQKNLHVQNRRGSGRNTAPEVLIINGASFTTSTSTEKE